MGLVDQCKCCKKGNKGENLEKERVVRPNNPSFNEQFTYANNYIKTSKYNMFTFVPKNLFEQFQRLANFYFLILMILQLIPQISSLTPLTTILPLVAVLLVTGAKDAVDDIQRHRSDNQVNNRESKVVREGNLSVERWQNVKVGDIVRMENDNFVAADLILLSTSEPHGLCYIETAELDGETNLKARQALTDTSHLMDEHEKFKTFDAEVICEPPNNRLNSYEGRMEWGGKTYGLDNEKLLLRGCILRNTKWCYGLVIFAGKDTKLMMNGGKTKFKRTSLDRFLNVLIIGIVIFLLSMCLICSILCGIWEYTTGQHFRDFLPWDAIVPTKNGKGASITFIAFLVFFSYAILLNTVVPISLYVSVEIIRFAHSWWINWDKEMYYAKNDVAARARTTTLNEELGQIQYIFSDKTGTLTQNIMTFNKCSIGGTVYGDLLDNQGHPIEITEQTKYLDFSWNPMYEEKFRFYDQKLLDDTKSKITEVAMFWRLLALCHTVMPETKDGKLVYQAQSPDEEALTSGARNFGFVFKSRTPDSITIEVDGIEETYELLCILDFNNVRKRMSVLVRDPTGKLMLFCKGADTLVLERIDRSKNRDMLEVTQSHLDKFAGEGLRTLVCAYKEISDSFYASWKDRQHAASISLEERQEKLDAVYEEIEEGMTLLGATAIEDKLQDGVPRTIANLAAANIKIWVLTGDKQETAINIGYSAQLLTDEMQEIFIVDGTEAEAVHNQLFNIKRQIDKVTKRPTSLEENPAVAISNGSNDALAAANGQMIFSSNQHAGSTGNICDGDFLEGFALIINGHSLTHALEPDLEQLFLEIGCQCKAVICCRVTPLQKAMVVDLVKRNKKAVTLSVGDGANDVSMIKTAHIGVGISGQEGMQAVLASDYSIGQFRFLERLLLVHGRWSYLRMSKFLKYFFYKNFAFTLAHFWYAFFCGYSAQTVYDPANIACYNLFFTSMPVLCLGIFDQDVNEVYSIRYPKLYIPGQYNLYFNMRIFVYSVLHGILSSLILFFIPFGALHDNVAHDGKDIGDYDTLAFTIFSALVIVVTAQIALDTAYWTFFNHLFIWGSVVLYYLFVILYYEAFPFKLIRPGSYGIAFRAMGTPQYWFCIILTTVLLLLPVIAVRFFWFDTHPTLSDRLRVRQNLRRLQKGVSELPLRPFSRASTRRRRGSVRSGYAFSHQQGFGDLITKGMVWRALGNAAERSGVITKRLSPIREQKDIVPQSASSLHSIETMPSPSTTAGPDIQPAPYPNVPSSSTGNGMPTIE